MIQTSHGLDKVVCCSFPRSGQSLVRPVVMDYFGEKLKYCEWYDESHLRPNVCEETNFVKTHDRDLNWHIREDWKYLVLIRNPLDAVSSWRIMEQEKNYNAGWKLDLWARWTTRWVINPVPNRLIVSYESMVNNPQLTLMKIVDFIQPKIPINGELIHDIILRRRIGPRLNHAQDWLGYL